MNANDIANAAVTEANALANKKQREADHMRAVAPYIPGEPRHLIPNGKEMMVCYKIRTITELRELVAALPPVDSYTFKNGCAGIRPNDDKKERAGFIADAYGVAINVEKSATTGRYPCDQHAMNARWLSDTPAGRLNVRVDFYYNAHESWPTLWARYERLYDRNGRQTGDSVRLEAWGCNRPLTNRFFRYGSGDPQRYPGSYSFYFNNAEEFDNTLDSLED